MKNKCVLAFSGGLDTSGIIPWLKDQYDFEVIAYCCNVGNLPPEVELRERALALGASDFVYEDAQDEFVSSYVFPMLRAGATYFDDYLLGTAIARPLIAEKVASFARSIGAHVLVHGATGKGNDHVRFERAWAFLCPEMKVIAPWKIWNYRSREELVSYLHSKNYVWKENKKNYSVDLNTLHRSCEGGDLESIEQFYSPSEVQNWIQVQPDLEAQVIALTFEKGYPTKINGRALSPKETVETLNAFGSRYGIGLCDIVEERANGIKSRGVYETPGGTIIHVGLKALKQICLSRELYNLAKQMSDQFGELIYDGLWFSDSRFAVDSFFEKMSERVSGEISLQLSAGGTRVMSRRSEYSLYSPGLVSFESDEMDIHKAALGYTKILTLSSLVQGQRERKI